MAIDRSELQVRKFEVKVIVVILSISKLKAIFALIFNASFGLFKIKRARNNNITTIWLSISAR